VWFVYVRAYTHTKWASQRLAAPPFWAPNAGMPACTHVRVYIWMYEYTWVCVYMCLCLHTYEIMPTIARPPWAPDAGMSVCEHAYTYINRCFYVAHCQRTCPYIVQNIVYTSTYEYRYLYVTQKYQCKWR